MALLDEPPAVAVAELDGDYARLELEDVERRGDLLDDHAALAERGEAGGVVGDAWNHHDDEGIQRRHCSGGCHQAGGELASTGADRHARDDPGRGRPGAGPVR